MENIVWTILIPQNYIDFHIWEPYTTNLQLNLIQTSKNNKRYIEQNLQIH